MIGLFGGTFDPVHYGHLRPALEIYSALKLDEMRFIPAAQPPHRQTPQASASQRRDMLELALADQPGFVLDDRELRRAGPSYMIDTLISLRADLGPARPMCLVLGLDAFAGLESWHRWQELLDLAHIVIAQRPALDQGLAETQIELSEKLQGLLSEHLTEQPDQLEAQPSGSLYRLTVTQLAISASMIRTACEKGKSCRYLLPEAVYQYIQRTGLYQSPE
ncbi:MAG TPA: nicotinate-nucleotide adenylyltransferase [Gammaproteobacteria bacterium]|nr:nicotinate-nucleotide adenylyltransferase [Gammaproteobacteria bacterium]